KVLRGVEAMGLGDVKMMWRWCASRVEIDYPDDLSGRICRCPDRGCAGFEAKGQRSPDAASVRDLSRNRFDSLSPFRRPDDRLVSGSICRVSLFNAKTQR